MITTKKLFSALVALSMSIVMVSCAGEDGEQGPAGPAGNANVNSYTFTVVNSDYTVYQLGQNAYFMHRDTLDVPAINENVLNSGTVQVFRRSANDSTSWASMPYSFAGINYNSSYAVGEVRLDINYGNSSPISLSEAEFKVVVIPSSSLVEGIDPTDYNALEAVYGLK